MGVDELAPDMSQTGDFADRATAVQIVAFRIAVGGHPAAAVRDMVALAIR